MSGLDERERVIGELRRAMPELRADHSVRSLSMFGSMARGEAGAGSDVDLLVEFERTPGLMAFVRLRDQLSDRLGVTVDLVIRSALKPRVAAGALRDEVPV